MVSYLTQLYRRFNAIRGRRVFIIPSRFGFVFAAFLVLILLGAINYSNSMGHILSFLLGSLAWVAMHHSYRNVAKIELTQAHANSVFLGQDITYTLLLDNPSKQDSYQLVLASKHQKNTHWNPFKRLRGFQHVQQVAQLSSAQTSTVDYHIPSLHRGYQPLGELRIASQFPIGLFTSWSYFQSDCRAIVYPKPSGDLPLPNSSDIGEHQHSSHTKGHDDFADLHDYREGDAIRAIAWKALARDDVLRTKQFNSFQGGQCLLSWQAVAQLNDSEQQLSQLCQWILEAEQQGINYGLSLPNCHIEFGQGQRHRDQCLRALALYHD